MYLVKLLKKLLNKIFFCKGAKVRVEDQNNDGIPDNVSIGYE